MIARPSTRHIMAALVALALVGHARPAAAQTPAESPSPAAVLIAKQIVELKGVKAMMDPIPRGVVEKVKNLFMQTNFMWAKDLDEVAIQLHKEFDPRASELVDASARIYASHFTEPELRQILAFYQSPLGQKMIAEEPKTIDESMVNAGKWATNLSDEVMAKMRADMKKRGHDM